jgi:aconitate hydratase
MVAALPEVCRATGRDLGRLPYTIRVLLENGLRHCGRGVVEEEDVLALLDWDPMSAQRPEFAFMPARVLLQDFTGVPCVVDLAALRSAVSRAGGDPAVIDPLVPVDLVIDHSVQVDCCAVADACSRNMALEMERNAERYALLRWAQGEFHNLRVMPPGTASAIR